MASIDTSDFFNIQRNTSEIKSEILNEYFKAWCGIMLLGQRFRSVHTLVYVDLYAGQGSYEDGKPSTPIKILNSIFTSDPRYKLNQTVRTFFNDAKKPIVTKLKKNLASLPFYDDLVHKPIILNEDANFNLLAKLLSNENPSLTFIDPFGYRFSQQMLLQSVKKWGSDLFMLFNLNRIRSAVKNSTVNELMIEIFGSKRLSDIRDFYSLHDDARKREEFIIENFEAIFKEKGYRTFKFKIDFPRKHQTSHYLIFVSKVDIAYMKIKEIMLKYSDYQEDGVPLFGANIKHQISLFQEHYKYSIKNLVSDLAAKASYYNKLSIDQIYKHHNIGTNYIKANYKVAFETLRNEGLVQILNQKTQLPINKITFTAIINYNTY